jgi:glycosyltransferase involved in cell wall biosynthesis
MDVHMRIVHLTASAFLGGPERQMLGLAEAMSADFANTFLSFSEGGRCRPFLSAVRNAGFDAAELFHDSPRVYSAARELTAFLRGNLTDVLVTHGYKSNLVGRSAARQVGIPIVSVARGWTGESWKVRCYEALDRLHLRLMDRVVCVSQGQAAKVLRAGVPFERVRVIRNGARLHAFERPDPGGRERVRELAGGDGPVVLAAGRLSPEKGFAVLIEAAHLVTQAVPDARFVLCGDGSQRPALEQRVEALNLAGTFRLVGHRSDLDSLLPWATVVALPSFTEGLPNVALEAAAAGVPVVATAVGGTPEVVVNGRTGFLVPPGDPVRFAARIIDLLRNPEVAALFGSAAREHMHEHFTFAVQAQAYETLFTELLADRRRSARASAVCA